MVGARFWTKEVNCRFLHGLLDRCIENEIAWGLLLVRIVVLTGAEHVELRWFLCEWFNWLLWGSCKYVIVYYWLSRRLALKYRLAGNWNTRLWKELIILGLDKWASYCRLWGQGWSKITEGIVLVFHISLLLSSDCYFLICQRKEILELFDVVFTWLNLLFAHHHLVFLPAIFRGSPSHTEILSGNRGTELLLMALIRLREPGLNKRASKRIGRVVVLIHRGLHHRLSHHWLLLL
jgi:hypothetical protein